MKHFASYELSKLAKEKWFDEACVCIHPNKVDGASLLHKPLQNKDLAFNGFSGGYLAPSYSQILDFAYQKTGKHIIYDPREDKSGMEKTITSILKQIKVKNEIPKPSVRRKGNNKV